MKYYEYEVCFGDSTNPEVCVREFAGNENDAVILATADRIRAGLHRTLVSVKLVDKR